MHAANYSSSKLIYIYIYIYVKLNRIYIYIYIYICIYIYNWDGLYINNSNNSLKTFKKIFISKAVGIEASRNKCIFAIFLDVSISTALDVSTLFFQSFLWINTIISTCSLCRYIYIYIYIWKNSALNCEAYSSFEGVSTDHRIVTAKIRLSLRKNAKRTATTKHYDWALLNNKDVRDKYVLELRNRFETLQEKTEKSTPNDEYENFVNAHLEAAAKYIPTKIKTKYRVPWETLAVREKRALVKTASKNYRKNPTNTNALKLKTAQYQLAGIYIKEQTEYIQNQIDKIRDSVEDRQSRIAWQTINEVSRRKNTAKAKLKAANQQERIKLWKQHFENLLGNPPKITHEPITRIISKQLDIKLGPFTQEELDSVLRKIKNRKAAGLDEIPPEV